jgi:hypothetical protein
MISKIVLVLGDNAPLFGSAIKIALVIIAPHKLATKEKARGFSELTDRTLISKFDIANEKAVKSDKISQFIA